MHRPMLLSSTYGTEQVRIGIGIVQIRVIPGRGAREVMVPVLELLGGLGMVLL
jgi:hypothetical protein